MGSDQAVDRRWLSRHPVVVAWELIGCILRLDRDGHAVAGRIVETEAYAGPLDPASHASRLKLAREVMASPPGTVYTYLSYGIHTMMNIVAHEEGQSGAVLLRAVEPLEGIDSMRARRNGAADTKLACGPGSLGQAFGIRLTDLGTDLLASDEWCLIRGEPNQPIFAGPRIGISRAVEAPWRFFEHPNAHVSRHRKGAEISPDEVVRLIPPPDTVIE